MADVLSIRLCLICLGASDYACTKVTCIFRSSITLILCYFIFSEGLIQMWATVIGLHRGVSSHQGCIYSDLCETEYHLYYSSPALSSLHMAVHILPDLGKSWSQTVCASVFSISRTYLGVRAGTQNWNVSSALRTVQNSEPLAVELKPSMVHYGVLCQ